METRIIKAVFGASKSIVAPKRFKNDWGQVLELVGITLPQTFTAHFANSKTGTAKKRIGQNNQVDVPDEFFTSGADIFCWVMVHDTASDGRTMYTVRIPIEDRGTATDEEPTPVQQDVIEQAIAALNSAVEQTAQNVESADASAQSAKADADRAETAMDTAEEYVSTVQNYAQQAQTSATNASSSATASANSASQAQQIKTDVEGMVDEAQSAAGASAQSALVSAQYASQASASATSASQSAETASTKASEASNSAQTASTKATEASGYASTASTKASEASQSASSASGYATAAGQAKTAAESAQTAAEGSAQTALTAAQTAATKAAEAAESARTLTIDPTLTQSGQAADAKVTGDKLTALTEPLPTYNVRYIEPTYLSGYMNESGVVSQSTSYKYTSEKIPVSPGDLVFIYREDMGYDILFKSLEGTSTAFVFRFVTAYSGDDVVVASGSNVTNRYVVPEGIDGIVVTVYTKNSLEQYEQKIRIQSALTEYFPNTFNILDGKKWCACGDSFTEAGYTYRDADLSYYTFTTGRFAGQRKTYPWIVGLRNNMDIANIAKSGMSMANSSGSNAFVLDDYYKNIPPDSDYITLKFGINDVNHGSQLGTIDSTDPTTFYGAWNIVMDYITTNFPYAKVGIIVSNGMSSTFTFVDATIAIAKKWGIPYLDEVYDPKVPLLHRVNRPDVCADVLQRKLEAFRISASNTHPNVNAQYYEAAFVEDWLRTL